MYYLRNNVNFCKRCVFLPRKVQYKHGSLLDVKQLDVRQSTVYKTSRECPGKVVVILLVQWSHLLRIWKPISSSISFIGLICYFTMYFLTRLLSKSFFKCTHDKYYCKTYIILLHIWACTTQY